jgi:hypothetical protein
MKEQQFSNAGQPEGERVRRSTAVEKNRKIDVQLLDNIRRYSESTPEEISARIRILDKEWDIERMLETNMSIIALTGLALAVFLNPYWLILPTVVLLFFLQHALQGWCPPIPLFRALKVRTRPEIDREKYALKALRGDFININNLQGQARAQAAFEATKKI